MWANWDPSENAFEIGEGFDKDAAEKRKLFERKLNEYGIWEGEEEPTSNDDILDILDQAWDESEQDELLSEVLQGLARERDEAEVDHEPTHEHHSAWHPYPSKLIFLLGTIDNLPRLRISSALMKAILWLLEELGVRNVPLFTALKKIQKDVRETVGVPTIHCKSSKGNAFSFNDPRALIANDWSNPLVRPEIRRYPIIPMNGVISEVWHAEKWRHDLERHVLSPMYDDKKGRHYFIDEPAALNNGNLVVPVRWLEDERGDAWADVWEVRRDEVENTSTIIDNEVTLIKARWLCKNMLDLVHEGAVPRWSTETISNGHPNRMPNPDRALADGDPIYTSFMDVFGDDVSGNKSKSWNKHWNIYMTHRNLPRKLLNQQFHTHFVSTSTTASVPEQFQAIKKIIESTHRDPVRVYDASSGDQIKFKIYCNCAPGDNPSQSETSGHIGGNGNHPCRKCYVGGTTKEKESDAGFHQMFYPGEARTSEKNLQHVEAQVWAACLGIAERVKELQTSTGIKDAFTQHWIEELLDRARDLKKQYPQRTSADIQMELMNWVDGNKDNVYNSFLTLEGFDPARDTPVEILHTILLGVVKYLWHGTHTSWTQTTKEVYAKRLQATNTMGLSIHAIRSSYIMQYANSLIGRQLKTLVQVNVFHVYDLVDGLQFLLTKALGEFVALLWFTEIRNRDEYLQDVTTAAANVLDIAALIDPSKIVMKIKYHLLSHIKEDIVRFGPMVGIASEVFEGFNAIFRYCSILSNHLAPSRDIAHQLSEQETVKHILSGGWWADEKMGWTRPGSSVQGFVKRNPVLQALIGWPRIEKLVPGSIRLEPVARNENRAKQPRPRVPWTETLAITAINHLENTHQDDSKLSWYRGKYVVARSEDQCKVGAWVYSDSPFTNMACAPIAGRIIEILQDTTSRRFLVVLDMFQVASTRHKTFGMPMLLRRLNEKIVAIVPATNILFEFNAQHDCQKARCSSTGRRAIIQERVASNIFEQFIEHQPLEEYIINTHAFHNAHLIRAVLPRALTAPIPFCIDQQTHHTQIAANLRGTQDEKRAATAKKAAERRQKAAGGNKRKRRQGDEGPSEPVDDVGNEGDREDIYDRIS
ncbi:hypothetical protein B0H34DRAFT_763800 [Crassisporium funariophilum]|nr:hypothetical protein B0H34DRAFT_763800 [Crassisporium funariophilum]